MKLPEDLVIEPLKIDELDVFVTYLHDHFKDNGAHEFGYFQPMSRQSPTLPPAKIEAIRVGLGTPLMYPGWRRAWVVRLQDIGLIGHVDLRARPEPFTSHRCLLGMGVHREYRRIGLGQRLLEFAMHWAMNETTLDWMDLEVISGNEPAFRLYTKTGFVPAGDLDDLFRIDGHSLASKTMVKRLSRGLDTRAIPHDFSVRAFHIADQAALRTLWERVFPDDPPWNAPELMIENKLKVQPELLLVGELDGAIVGAIIAGFDGVRGWLYHLAVDPEHCRRGFATKLVKAAEQSLRALGCRKVNLQVRTANHDVVAFYRRLGYQIEERVSMGRKIEEAE